MAKEYPAPWDLVGEGYIILYRFKKKFVNKNEKFIPDFLKGKFIGGFGCIMLVDYNKSTAGPYQELLYIPGKFDTEYKKLHSITKIYVSTMESVENGKRNWGIPKELANFTAKKDAREKTLETIVIKNDNAEILTITMKKRYCIFPVSTKTMSFPLIQLHEDKFYFTKFTGLGFGKFAKIVDIKVNKDLFPDIAKAKPLIAIKVEKFKITFPKARIIDKNNSSLS